MTGLLLALALAAPHRFTAQDAQALFEAGNAAYFRGDYETAAQKYEQLEGDGWSSGDVEYNLGTTLLAQGRLGRAILALERAKRLEPANDDVTSNLERARHELVDKVAGQAEEPLATRLADLLPLSLSGALFLGAWLLFWLALFGRRFGVIRGVALFAMVLGALGTLAFGALLGVQWYASERLHQAVVVGATVPAREGPNAASKSLFELHEGTELRILDHEGEFVRVRLANGLEGWAQASGVEEI